MGAYIEDLLADERWFLVKEMHEMGTDHPHYQTKLAEVRMCEKWLDYVRGSMRMAGWRD